MVTHAAINKLASAIFSGNTRRIDELLIPSAGLDAGHDRVQSMNAP
jgi:hypothetical protein